MVETRVVSDRLCALPNRFDRLTPNNTRGLKRGFPRRVEVRLSAADAPDFGAQTVAQTVPPRFVDIEHHVLVALPPLRVLHRDGRRS